MNIMTLKHMPAARDVPAFPALMAQLGHPPAPAVAKALGVGESTVWRWMLVGKAPRPACIALLWATEWGWAQALGEARHSWDTHRSLIDALRAENDRLRGELGRVLALADAGAANVPSLAVSPLAEVVPITVRR